jgi:hypothetical protein
VIEIRTSYQADLDFVQQNPLEESVKFYGQLQITPYCKTGLVDGVIMGVGGVRMLWPGVGEGWFVLSKDVLSHKVAVVRCLTQLVDQSMIDLDLRRLQATVAAKMPQALALDLAIGFVNETPLGMQDYLPEGGTAYMLARYR